MSVIPSLLPAGAKKPKAKLSRALFTNKVNTWGTPQAFYDDAHELFGFTLDACALPDTAKCKRYVHPNADGLNVSWHEEIVWNNPPYDDLLQWMVKARNESIFRRVISANLIPRRGDTEWWGKGVLCDDSEAGRLLQSYYDEANRVWWYVRQRLVTGVWEPEGRITFDGETADGEANNAPFPSALVIHASRGLKPKRRRGITSMWPH